MAMQLPQYGSLSPADVKLVLEVLPGAIDLLAKALENRSFFGGNSQAKQQLSQVKEALRQYASMHYALKDWKFLHDGLHDLSRQLPLFKDRCKRCPGSISPETLREDWDRIKETVDRILNEASLFRHISETIELETLIRSSQTVNWRQELRSLLQPIEISLRDRSERFDEAASAADELYVRVNQMVSGANRELIQLASDLSDLSLRLSGKIE